MDKFTINIQSEIGKLNGVLIHTPGAEVENMTPENAERALYSDILNLSVALPEYNDFLSVLKKTTNVFEVKDLLGEVLNIDEARQYLLGKICGTEKIKHPSPEVCQILSRLSAKSLAKQLIEGVPMIKNNLTHFLDNERYSIHPLPNFFFTRDASFSMGKEVMISKMANAVRDREAMIMETIFKFHNNFETTVINPILNYDKSDKGTIEGGDVIIASENIFIVGNGNRTSTQGIDSLIEHLKTFPGEKHLIIQELPKNPESFIHLDMTFTLLDRDQCMIYEPLILHSNKHFTVHITIDGDKVKSIKEEKNLLKSLKKLGMDLNPINCGGNNDLYIMEREQWQSGANFFSLEPGKIIGYERNIRTIDALNKNGYEVISANDIATNKVNISDYKKAVITIKGDELSRGGGGARCMTMPLNREKL